MALSPTEEGLVRQLIAQNPALLNLASSESTIISKLVATKVSLSDLSAATSLSDADLALVRQGLNDKSFAMSVLMDYVSANLPTASTTTKGIVELATNTETQTGTDAVRAVTPAGLASVTATETRAGLIEIATTAEAQAFAAGKAIDGAKLAAAFGGANQGLAPSGYQKLPGGLILQWGASNLSFNEPGTLTVAATYPISFTSAVFREYASVSANLAGGSWWSVSLASSGLGGGNVYCYSPGYEGVVLVNWFVIGR